VTAALPSFITIDDATRTFTVQTNDPTHQQAYTVVVVATLND